MELAIIGDSISLGYGLPDNINSYVDILSKYNNTNIDVLASCGATIEDAILRSMSIPKKYDIIIINIGTNGIVYTESLYRLYRILIEYSKDIIICNTFSFSDKNDVILQFANMYKIKFCNLYIPHPYSDDFLLEDGIHPNERGHRYIAENLQQLINRCLN